MPTRKIIVPDGMLLAAGGATKGVDPRGYLIYLAVEAALRWLSENPIVPTSRDIQRMSDSLNEQGDFYHSVEAYCVEWQRRMFLAPEPTIPSHLADAFRGITLTQSQANAIHDLVNMCTRPSKETVR